MELYHTTDQHGISELNPSTEKMRKLLDSLAKENEEEEFVFAKNLKMTKYSLVPIETS